MKKITNLLFDSIDLVRRFDVQLDFFARQRLDFDQHFRPSEDGATESLQTLQAKGTTDEMQKRKLNRSARG